jgi:hypothetical protein
MKEANLNGPVTGKVAEEVDAFKAQLSEGEKSALDTLRARPMLRFESSMNLEMFNFVVIDGLKLNLEKGNVGLVKAAPPRGPPPGPGIDVMGLMMGDGKLDDKPKEQPKEQPAEPLAKTTASGTVTETNTIAQKVTSTWSKFTSFFQKLRNSSS